MSSNQNKKVIKTAYASHKDKYEIKDIDGRASTLKFTSNHLMIDRVVQPTVIIHLFSTKTRLCRIMLPYLSRLQHKNINDIFVLGIVVPEKIDDDDLRKYMIHNDTAFFISNSSDNRALASMLAHSLQLGSNYPLPLTIVFYNGKYITHYEGVTPIEMIYNDFGNIDSKLKRLIR